ncbi:serine/threonine-protein kinase rio2-like [Salvia splendens]|uniref:serine/threonine-protein kinase rio2-like n=1 Tax=Salvia splendens TaxID=180675 RepID=UPI0011053CC6|nr:serine/threonine-protein kinase rio2-like [Salvia splendens]
MKLDVNALRYLTKDDFRVLTAVEMGMRNHEIVPAELIGRIASLKHGGTYKVLKNLLKHKLVHHDSSKYDGFRLTYLGYDFLAIKTLVNRGVFASVGRQIGVGKESDIFEVGTEDGTVLAMKLHRLGRVSFRAVKSKRDYLRHRRSFNWLYLSRLAAIKEFAFMKALEEHGFPVPNAVDCNRHCVIMSLVQGYPLVQVKELPNPDTIFETILGLVVRLAEHGLIHCDFNEFNIMIDDDEKVTMIDFPQMISVSHRNAHMYFDRDIECIFKFFRKRFHLSFDEKEIECDDSDVELGGSCRPQFSDINKVSGVLDKELEASGFTRKDQDDMEKFVDGDVEEDLGSDSGESEDADDTAQHINDATLSGFESLSLTKEEGDNLHEGDSEANQNILHQHTSNEARQSSEMAWEDRQVEHHDSSADDNSEEEEEEEHDDDPELEKRLTKQRQRAIQAARGRRKGITSRNSYKDKGGKSSHNSKIQKQLGSW